MTIEVEIQGTNQIVEFPDGTSPEVIRQALTQEAEPSVADTDAEIQRQTIVGRARGVAGAAANILSSGAADIAGGVTGLTTALLTGDPAAGEFVRKGVSEKLTIPASPLGEEILAGIGEEAVKIAKPFVDPAKAILEPTLIGPTVGAIKEIESEVLERFGPEAATALTVLPLAAVELIAARLGAGPIKKAGERLSEFTKISNRSPIKQSATKQRIAKLIEEGSTDAETAGFKLDKSIKEGAPRVVEDKVGAETLKQGFDEGVIASVKGSSKVDKAKMLEMVNIKQRGKKNAEFAIENRASDVLGESLMERVRIILRANKEAGTSIDDVAKSLRGKNIDLSGPADNFAQGLQDLGVLLVSDGKGGLKPNFEFSDLAPGDRGPIKEVIRQMNLKGRGGIDGFSAHRMKRAIDNNVTFGKSKTGISGDAERLLKKFRNDIDGALDSTFPEYDRVNAAYSETINALDALQDSVGKKLDLKGPNADKATGTALRKLLSNAQGRINLLDSLEEIEKTAKKFEGFVGKLDPRAIEFKGPKVSSINDNLIKQVLFVDELDRVFKPSARTGFAGQIGQAVTDVPTTARGAALKAIEKGIEKAQGINEAGAFKSIRDLLSE